MIASSVRRSAKRGSAKVCHALPSPRGSDFRPDASFFTKWVPGAFRLRLAAELDVKLSVFFADVERNAP